VDSVKLYSLSPAVQVLRGLCSTKLRTEVEYMLKHGSSDNSYIISVPGAVMLVDVPYEAYSDKFVAALAEATPLSGLTHILITHLDPKSIPTLELLLARLKAAGSQPILTLSNPALRLLQSTLEDKPERKALLSGITLNSARTGQHVSLGTDPTHVLELELTPTPRWPDLMTAYYPPARILFSSKFFSCHTAPPEGQAMDVGGWARYAEDWRYFHDCMLAPSARQALAALDKLDLLPVPLAGAPDSSGARPAGSQPAGKFISKLATVVRDDFAWLRALLSGRKSKPRTSSSAPVPDMTQAPSDGLQVSILAPMHGPAVGSSVAQLVREYRGWTTEQIKASDVANVTVLYASAYGNTAALAQAISRGVTKAGVGVNTLNLEVASLDEVVNAIQKADGFIIGSPTLGGHMPTQVTVALGAVMRQQEAKALPCGVFGSFGWSGEAVDQLEKRLRDAGFGFAFPAVRVKFKPTSKDLMACEDSGRDLALAVKRRSRARQAAAAPGVYAAAVGNTAQLAAGRIVGSLAVVTAMEEDASAAMLASWVSQASFEPPGLTVAVKKDRAMQPLMQVGSQFVISTVPEKQERMIMRSLARSFAPGDDRLAGLETIPGEITGAPVLKLANAYMECTVVSRMEAGDHWIVYASVLGGAVLDEAAPTAVHHRKVANHY